MRFWCWNESSMKLRRDRKKEKNPMDNYVEIDVDFFILLTTKSEPWKKAHIECAGNDINGKLNHSIFPKRSCV